MSMLKIPQNYDTTIEAHRKWLSILQKAQDVVEEDEQLQKAAANGMRLKTRALPPEVVGRNYARYCELVNQLYDAYLNNVQLQRAPYILEIIAVFVKRLYELRNELVHIIVNDYIYVDAALQQLHKTPLDIQIVVPYHFPLESRSENVESILQQMWVDALKRKKRREGPKQPKPAPTMRTDSGMASDTEAVSDEEEDSESPPSSIQTIMPEEYVQSVTIQRHERYRQWRMRDVRAKAQHHKQYYLISHEPAPIELRTKAALLIQRVYREFMKIKRERVKENKRDILLGLIPDPFRRGPSFVEANNKVYDRRRNTRMEIKKTYLEDLQKEKARLLLFKKDATIEDITDEIREWIQEWFYGYHFFPQFPYELEGGTLMVVRGDYPTINEKLEEDERMLKETQGKTKEQLKEEHKKAKEEAKIKARMKKESDKKEAEALLKSRCDPFSDPGYTLQTSGVMGNLIEALRNYRQTWSLYDVLPPEQFGETIYGYLKPLLIEDLMKEMHIDCRKFVDELMRTDLKMLIQKHEYEYEKLDLKYPKMKPRKKPKPPPQPKVLVLDEKLLKSTENVFDLGIVTKPTEKFIDIFGDSNYAAYEYNVKDPDASFPLPGYGDIKERLMLSCVLGCGIQPGAPRRKAVMLLGPDRNGKSFLADAVAGELNAIKIDITPEVFTAIVQQPQKVLNQVFVTARAFQPAVVFMKNVERVFAKKVLAEQKDLKATSLKGNLGKVVKSIPDEDKVIFIATCTDPWAASVKPMLKVFDEILLVPRTDYASLQQFFYNKFQSIRSMPRDYPVQPLAQVTQGFGFADIIEVYNEVMTPDRIVKLNIKQLSPGEFLDALLQNGSEPLTVADYQKYVDFYISNSTLKQEREDYARINFVRADVYKKAEKKKLKTESAKSPVTND